MDYKVNLLWDAESSVWVATSDDVPGLVLESGSYDALIEKVKNAIPELLELNKADNIKSISFVSQRLDKVA